jgi:hypothetical protein
MRGGRHDRLVKAASEPVRVRISVTFMDVPKPGSRQYWTRESVALNVPRVGDEISVPGPSSVRVHRVIWDPDLRSVDVVLEDCPREIIRQMLAVFDHDDPEAVETVLDGDLTNWIERAGWHLRGDR